MVSFQAVNPSVLGVNRASFSQVTVLDGGTLGSARLVFISGQVATNAQGDLVGKDDISAQCLQVFENLGHAVDAAGGTIASVLQLRTYLTHREDISAFIATRRKLYTELFPDGRYPANTLLIVAGLAHQDYRLEVEAIAVT